MLSVMLLIRPMAKALPPVCLILTIAIITDNYEVLVCDKSIVDTISFHPLHKYVR